MDRGTFRKISNSIQTKVKFIRKRTDPERAWREEGREGFEFYGYPCRGDSYKVVVADNRYPFIRWLTIPCEDVDILT